MRKLIYTSIFGGYDRIHHPKTITHGWDYVCVTDKPRTGTGWNILPYNNDMPRWLIAREPKIKFHNFFNDYDISIYVDGSIDVDMNLDEFVEKNISESADMALMQHPARLCVYNEIHACVVHKKVSKGKASEIEARYKSERIPKLGGMVQCGIIIRKHDRPNLKKFCDLWFEETKFTTRDQLSFMHTIEKNKIISYNLFSAHGFKIHPHS